MPTFKVSLRAKAMGAVSGARTSFYLSGLKKSSWQSVSATTPLGRWLLHPRLYSPLGALTPESTGGGLGSDFGTAPLVIERAPRFSSRQKLMSDCREARRHNRSGPPGASREEGNNHPKPGGVSPGPTCRCRLHSRAGY